MKKILFLILLGTICIPITQTYSSNREMDTLYKLKANDTQTMVKPASKGLEVLNNENLLHPNKIKIENRIRKTSRPKEKLTKVKISKEKRDQLFGILLLVHRGKR